jgi:hypothetical protein
VPAINQYLSRSGINGSAGLPHASLPYTGHASGTPDCAMADWMASPARRRFNRCPPKKIRGVTANILTICFGKTRVYPVSSDTGCAYVGPPLFVKCLLSVTRQTYEVVKCFHKTLDKKKAIGIFTVC